MPAAGPFVTDEDLDFTVNFSESVDVTGSPSLSVTMTSGVVDTVYVSGSGTASLLFRRVVEVTDSEAVGISISSPVALNGGTIKDLGGLDAVLTFTPPSMTGVLVN